MAMGLPYGLQAMLKDGHKHFSGLEEAVLRNIEACKNLSQITRTSLGPNGAWSAMCFSVASERAGHARRPAPFPKGAEVDGRKLALLSQA